MKIDLTPLPPPYVEFLGLLQKFHIDYMLVGGWAVSAYSSQRVPGYLDVLVRVSPDSMKSLQQALLAFHSAPIDLTAFSVPGHTYRIGSNAEMIVLMNQIQGIDFGPAWTRRETTLQDAMPIHIIARHDLILNKQAVGRPKDLTDLAALKI